MAQSVSRRSVLRDIGALSAVAALGGAKYPLQAQTPPPAPAVDPFANDTTIFFVGPWLFFAKAPGMPGMILAMTCEDSHGMHKYCKGLYTAGSGIRPSGFLDVPKSGGGYIITSDSSVQPATVGNLFSDKQDSLFCIDNSAGGITLAPSAAKLRKIYLPIPDAIIPDVLIPVHGRPQTAPPTPPAFYWPDAPASQVFPTKAATTLIFQYKNGPTLSMRQSNADVPSKIATKGQHYHFEVRLKKHLSASDGQSHARAFSTQLASTFVFQNKLLDLIFDPGLNSCVTMSEIQIDPSEVGVKKVCPHAVPGKKSYENGDCSAAIMVFNN